MRERPCMPDYGPPRLAQWLLELFFPKRQVSPVLGDLREEFAEIASAKGTRDARRWYWRQTAKTIPHLLLAEFMAAPRERLGGLAAGLLAITLAYMPLYVVPAFHWGARGWPWVRAISLNGLVSADFYPVDWPQALRLVWMDLHRVIPPMTAGWVLARGKRGDTPATVWLTLATILLGIAGWFADGRLVTTPSSVWSLVWLSHPDAMVVCPIAIFIGGMWERITGRTKQEA